MSSEEFNKYTTKLATMQPTVDDEFKAKDAKEYEEMLLDFVRKQFEGV